MTTANVHIGRHFTRLADGRTRCDVCPRACALRPGQRGFCFVRQATDDGAVALTTYGRSSGFCIDPIEKKPLFHFLPGTSVLSFGTAGCNLGCKFCQNWSISKAREFDTLQDEASPEAIAAAAVDERCASVAFTYNDPTIFLEYAIDAARACRARGVRSVAVTAGYIQEAAARELYDEMDAANIDLKGFTEDFYRSACLGELAPVKRTIAYVATKTTCWLELTTLLIPGLNDDDKEIDEMTRWIAGEVGPSVPLHFTAFHPDYRMADRPHTPASTLVRAREIAKRNGLHHVYTGNVRDPVGQSTTCTACGGVVVERDRYDVLAYRLDELGGCRSCGARVPGRFLARAGTWGTKRKRLTIAAS